MKLFVTAVLIFFGVLRNVIATDYCDAALCPAGVTNIGCNNPGTKGSACPSDFEEIKLTTTQKQAIVKAHNLKRSQIADGNLQGFDPATRMATISWNQELADLARLNAIRCIYGHDKCHNTDLFKSSGQNIAKTWWSGTSSDDMTTISNMIDEWWSEHADASMSDVKSYPSAPAKTIGHFTVMAVDKNSAVGCAGVKFTDPAQNMNSLTFVCNYASTNIIGKPLYTAGPTARSCTKGTNTNYPALCSLQEPYN